MPNEPRIVTAIFDPQGKLLRLCNGRDLAIRTIKSWYDYDDKAEFEVLYSPVRVKVKMNQGTKQHEYSISTEFIYEDIS